MARSSARSCEGVEPEAELDCSSIEVAGGMTGRMAGVAVSHGSALVRSFTYTGADDAAAVTGR